MDAPTAAEVQDRTKLEELKAADAADADETVASANALLKRITGLDFATVPADLEPLVRKAVRGLAESIWFEESAEQLETLSDFHLIQSFSAGPYSETRRSADDAVKAKMIHPWPWLNSLLWQLLTDAQHDFWIEFFGGLNAPAFEVTEVDWRAGSRMDDPFPTFPGGTPG